MLMAVFEYKGLTHEGKDVTGIIDADNPKSARAKLKKSGIFPIDVLEGKRSPRGISSFSIAGQGFSQVFGNQIRKQEVAIMTRQLATLVGAGLPLMEALDALVEQIEKGGLKRVIAGVRESVREGGGLADALGGYPRVFSELYVNMVRSGEASGTLDLMLLRLSDFLEKQVQLRNKVLAIMAYPMIMLAIGTIILFMLVTFVVPQVTSVFEEMGQVLPLPTRILLGISHFFQAYWFFLVLGLGVGIFFVRRWLLTEAGRDYYDRWVLKLPLLGSLFKRVAISRFTTTLSTLLSSGIPLLRSLEIVKEVVNNRLLAEAIHGARENIKEGESIAEPLKRSGIFPPLVTHMIAVGEKSGELEKVLLKVSEAYDHEVETLATTLTSLLTPILILVMGGIVLYIVVSILLPIFEMSQVIR